MYEEKLDVPERKRQENRLLQFMQSEVYRVDIRPWMMNRMTAARQQMFHGDSHEAQLAAIDCLGLVESFFTFVEGKDWEQRWQKKLEPESSHQEMPKEGLLNRWKRKLSPQTP